jgi:hypothetical protein
VRFSIVVAINHLTADSILKHYRDVAPESRGTDNVAHAEPFQQHYCCAKRYPRPAEKILLDSGEQEI